MSDRPRVVLALSPLAEREVESLLFDAGEGPVVLLASVVVADELQRAVAEHRPEAVLLSPGLSDLTAAHCERVRAIGARLVGLALDPREREELATLGVDHTLDATASREELVSAVRARMPQPRPAAATFSPSRPDRAEGERGTVLAVIGGKGAPGSSECAASLAAVLSRRWPAVLVEIDALGSGLSVRLQADASQGSVVGLIRAAQAGDGALGELLERWLIQRESWSAVLLGAPDPQALCELAQPGAINSALDALATLYPLVVCDVGFLIADSELPAARLHREALIAADAVLLVLGSSEAQLHNGLRQLEVIHEQLGIAPDQLWIAVGGVGAPAHANRTAIEHTVAQRPESQAMTVNAWLPWDARALKRSERSGAPLALAHRRGAYARAINGLLEELFLPGASSNGPKAKRRKRRLAAPRREHCEQEQEVALPWQT